MARVLDVAKATMRRKYPTLTTVSQHHRRSEWAVRSTDRLWGWMTEPAKSAAPEKARRGPASESTSSVQEGAGPARWSRRPMTEARRGDWSTQLVDMRCAIGASRRIRWTQTAPCAVLATLASTATITPVGPANALAVGTTQNAELGDTAHPSRAPSPPLRAPRVTM